MQSTGSSWEFMTRAVDCNRRRTNNDVNSVYEHLMLFKQDALNAVEVNASYFQCVATRDV